MNCLASGLIHFSRNSRSSIQDQGRPPSVQREETGVQDGDFSCFSLQVGNTSPLDLPQGGERSSESGRNLPPPHPRTSPARRGSQQEREAVTRPGGDDAAGCAGHSWPLPARSPTPLAWVTEPAKLPDTETPRGLRVSGTILCLMGSDSSAPPPASLPPLRVSSLAPHSPLAAGPARLVLPAGTLVPSTQPHNSLPTLRCVLDWVEDRRRSFLLHCYMASKLG